MNSKAEIESILKKRFFVTPTGYPSQNGFLDYGPVLTQIKQQVISEYRKVFVDETVYEIEPSAVLPYEVLKNSGHIDRFCDVIITDGLTIYRADHYIEDKLGENVMLPDEIRNNFDQIFMKMHKIKLDLITEKKMKLIAHKGVSLETLSLECEKSEFTSDEVSKILSNFKCNLKPVSDLNKNEIDFVVSLHNFYSPANLPFQPSKDFNLIFNLNDRQFLRPELAQSQFTNFRKLFEMNNEKLPFSSLCIGRSYRNEISARGGMLRTKEFEQAELEYFTEDGKHAGFKDIRDISVLILPNTCLTPYLTTLGHAFDTKVISSEAICYFLAKSQEFCLNIGIKIENLRYRQHSSTEMAHYANDCWDVEIKTLTGWVECAGIADRSNFDLTVHSKEVNTFVKRAIELKTVYDVILNKKDLGKSLKSKLKDFEIFVSELDQKFITENMKNNMIEIEFEGVPYACGVESRNVDCEFFIPRVIEPSFGISRVLYALVEQSFNIRDDRNVLSLKPKMAYLHCVIGFLKYFDEFDLMISNLKSELRKNDLRFKITERGCSIGKKYSSFDEVGVPFFITFDLGTVKDNQVTIRDRDSTLQIRVDVKLVAGIIESLVKEKVTWQDLMNSYGALIKEE